MQVLYERCCGIDVHKKVLSVCFKSGKKQTQLQYGTLTKDLRALADFLVEQGCQKVAMESTGSYWKPVYNILELLGLDIMVVNAQHMKAVPSHKTDVKSGLLMKNCNHPLILQPPIHNQKLPNSDSTAFDLIVPYLKVNLD